MKNPTGQRTAAPREFSLTATEAAHYIGETCEGLAEIADRAGLPVLAYFLNLARGAAEIAAKDNKNQTH